MAPAWKALKDRPEIQQINLFLINLDEKATSELKSPVVQDIQGFPTILEVKPGGLKGREYQGNRSTDDLVRFILETFEKKKHHKRRKTRHHNRGGGKKNTTQKNLKKTQKA